MLRQKIEQNLIIAQKAKDVSTVETLRFLLSAIKYKEVDTKELLTDDQVIDILTKQVKTHKESIEAFKKGAREDLVKKEEVQLKILETYLPAPMDEAEVKKVIEVVVQRYRDTGKGLEIGLVMKEVMPQLKGRADGNLVRGLVDQLIKE